jgi:hypothetical protein
MHTPFGFGQVIFRNSMLLRLLLAGLIVLTCESRGAESTNGHYAQEIAEWIALPKPRDPSVGDRAFRCVAALADARQAGLDPVEVAAKAVALAGLAEVLGQLTGAAILRNLKTAEDLECLDPEGVAAMRKGEAPFIRHPSHAGDRLQVNPVLPREYGMQLHNLVANLELLPAKTIASGDAKLGARQLQLARELYRAGLLSSRDLLLLEEELNQPGKPPAWRSR